MPDAIALMERRAQRRAEHKRLMAERKAAREAERARLKWERDAPKREAEERKRRERALKEIPTHCPYCSIKGFWTVREYYGRPSACLPAGWRSSRVNLDGARSRSHCQRCRARTEPGIKYRLMAWLDPTKSPKQPIRYVSLCDPCRVIVGEANIEQRKVWKSRDKTAVYRRQQKERQQ